MHHNIMKMCQLLLIQYKMKQCLRKYDMIVVLLFWLFLNVLFIIGRRYTRRDLNVKLLYL